MTFDKKFAIPAFAPAAAKPELAPRDVDLRVPIPAAQPMEQDLPSLAECARITTDYEIYWVIQHLPHQFAFAREQGICPICLKIGCPWVHGDEARAMGWRP